VKEFNEFWEQSISSSDMRRTLAKMTDEGDVIHLLCGIPRNDDWKLFLGSVMDKNAMATLTPDEIVMMLVENEAMIEHENGLGQEAPLFANGNAKGTGKGNGKSQRHEEK